MLWVLHFNHSPGVQTTTDLLSFHLNQLVGANHSKGNARLEKEDKGQWIPRAKQSQRKEVWKIKVSGRQGREAKMNRKRMVSVTKPLDGSV